MSEQRTIDAVRNATIQLCETWLRDEADRRLALGLDGAETCTWLADNIARGVKEALIRSMVEDLESGGG